MKEIKPSELQNASGGDTGEAWKYLIKLRKKYGGKTTSETLSKATSQEVKRFHFLATK